MMIDPHFKTLELSDVKNWANSEFGGKLGWTLGSFDLLHQGHLEFLQWAKNQSTALIVGVKADTLLDGNLYDQDHRTYLLGLMPYLDAVVVVDNTESFLKVIKGHFFFLGGNKTIDYFSPEEQEILKKIPHTASPEAFTSQDDPYIPSFETTSLGGSPFVKDEDEEEEDEEEEEGEKEGVGGSIKKLEIRFSPLTEDYSTAKLREKIKKMR